MASPFVVGSPYTATQITLSSGHVLFNDPSQAWSPTDFPNLPSSSLALTAQGRAVDGNVSTLTLTNEILYEAFEPTSIRSNLSKAFQVSQSGEITYAEAKIGFVSTSSAAFDYGTVSNFTQAVIGGPGIQDVLTVAPDTVTNALAKLDAWIANSFLFQPPAVIPVEGEVNSLWGGIRWNNFKTYALLDKSVPYVNSLLFILGDPTTANYLTLEVTDPQYFPFRTYTDGISPFFAPLVRLRIFTDFFPTTSATVSYSKSALSANCIRVVSESGTFTLPSSGKVVAIEKTNASDTYTTISIYLPSLPTTYPKDSSVPVRIVYLNPTAATANVVLTSTVQTSTGGPGPFASTISTATTQSALLFDLTRPVYSDLPHLVSSPFYSSYTAEYTFKQLATAHASNFGFVYGVQSPTVPTGVVSPYVGSTFQQSFVASCASTQSIVITGTDANPIVPGVLWSTVFYATNSAQLTGQETPAPLVASQFPTGNLPPNVSSMVIQSLNTTSTRYIASNQLRGISSGTVANSLTAVGNVSTDVVFVSSATSPITTFAFGLSTPVRFNDVSYPGDRSTISVAYTYKNAAGVQTTPVSQSLDTVPPFENFDISTIASTLNGGNELQVNVLETQSLPAYQRYFYKVAPTGFQTISTISTAKCELQFLVSNTVIPSFNAAAVLPQTQSSIVYQFQTEPDNVPSTFSISTTTITSTTQISGLTTPTPFSEFFYDVSGMNFAHTYAFSNFATGVVQFNGSNVGPVSNYASNVVIYDGVSPVTTLPIPQNTPLRLSSLTAALTSNVYQDVFDPRDLRISATLTPANPVITSTSLTTTQVISSLYIDTVSYASFLSSFSSTLNEQGQRILSLLPRIELPGTANDIGDSVNNAGDFGVGLDVTTSSFFTVTASNTIEISSITNYSHTSSLYNSTFTEFYTRELLYTNAQFIHPAGYNFSQFSTNLVGLSNAFPDFTYDLIYDVNKGYRYATFAYEWPSTVAPTPYRYLYVKVNAPNLVSSIGNSRVANNWWPDLPVADYLMSTMKVRMHVKMLGSYYSGTYETFESAWLNGFKVIDQFDFDDSMYDGGAAISTEIVEEGVEYKIAFNRRFYTKLMAVVRVGIAQDGSVYSGEPLTFQSMNARVSDV